MVDDRVEHRDVLLALSPTQVREIVRQAEDQNGVAAVLAGLAPIPRLVWLLDDKAVNGKTSRSLLRGLMVIAALQERERARGVKEIATLLDMSPSTTHRYLNTLVAAGLLERHPVSRKYYLPAPLRRDRRPDPGSYEESPRSAPDTAGQAT